MEILKNSNNYYGLVSDYKNGNAFRDAIIAGGARGKLAVIATVNMRPLTEEEFLPLDVLALRDLEDIPQGEMGYIGNYDGTPVAYGGERHWIPVDVPCETSDVFYRAVETEIPVVEEVIEISIGVGDCRNNEDNPVIDTIVMDSTDDVLETTEE